MPSSLRGRLALLVVVALLPVTALVFAQNLGERQHLSDEARADALGAAQSIAGEERRLVEVAIDLLTAISASPDVHAFGTDSCNDVFERLLEESDGYANMGIADSSGFLRCSGLPFNPPVDVSDRP